MASDLCIAEPCGVHCCQVQVLVQEINLCLLSVPSVAFAIVFAFTCVAS